MADNPKFNPLGYKNTDGPFVLVFDIQGNYYSQFNGQMVRVTFSGGPGTHDIKKAKLFYTVSSAKNSSYSLACRLAPVDITVRP